MGGDSNGAAAAEVKAAPYAFIGMPGYGEITAGASRGFWRATRRPESEVRYEYQEGSLLACNFNRLWVAALNLAAEGRAPAYFAMQHADIEPEDWWLDTLIAELDRTGLDILGVPAPIKSPEGITSLALAHPSGDPWRPLCRLSMTEVARLPETFTGDDIGPGHKLLLNTGLWVCRFRMEWASKVKFTILDRIVVDPQGRYHAQTEPEDWFFSRLCHELGLKVGATKKVRLTHRGPVAFPNDRVWGAPFDSAWIDGSIVPEADGFRFPGDVDGWLSYAEGKALYELAKGKRVLEIGSYCGRSTICLAQSADHVMAIDYFDGRATPEPKDTWEVFWANLRQYRVAHRVFAQRPGSELLTAPYGLVFIDGAHDYESVARDIAHATEGEVLAPGGLLAFHDYRTKPGEGDGRWDPGVTQAVNELIERGGKLLARHDSLAVVRPPAAVLSTSHQEN